ncbi:unnamed protein product [Mucor circinelloides]
MSTDATSEPLLFSSSDYDNEELARLVELQRRQTELLQPDIDNLDFEDDEDDFSVTNRAAKKGPTVPDMRFEKQVEKSIAQLQEKGASNFSIAWSIVLGLGIEQEALSTQETLQRNLASFGAFNTALLNGQSLFTTQ